MDVQRTQDVREIPASEPGSRGAGRDAGQGTSARAGEARRFLAVAALVLLSRLPFLGPGCGSDPDAWRVASAARAIATTGRYVAARFPGNPVQESACSLIWRGGPAALTGATALMAALGAGFFALAFRRLGGRDDVLAAAALASVPAYYLVSVQSLDYAWALAFALAALYFALAGRPFVAGGLAGLAVGCRVTSGAWLVPLSMALASARPAGTRGRAILAFVGSALVIGALAYLPSYLESGMGFFRYYDHGYPGALFVIRTATLDLWGIPGALALLLAVPLALRGARRAPASASIVRPRSMLLTGAWCLGLGLFVVAYLRLPYKPAYLIPALPLLLLLLGQWLRRRVFVAVCLALVGSPWVLGVGPPDPTGSLLPSPSARTFQVRGHLFVLDWLHGPLLAGQATRRHGVQYVEQSLARARRLRGESVVVAWDWLPQIKVRQGGDIVGPVRYVYLLTPDELRELRARQVGIYDLVGAEWANVQAHGVSLRQNGSRSLDALN